MAQRQQHIIIVIALFILLAMALFMFTHSLLANFKLATFFSKSHRTVIHPQQPLMFPLCLSDNAKFNNYYLSKPLITAVQQPNFSIIKVSSHSRCSAQFSLINFAAKDLPGHIIKLAMRAYHHARLLGYDRKQLLTIVDYVKPSNKDRLWVFDLNTDKLLFHTLVSHGAASGKRFARHFSNVINSHKSSLGVILTGKRYPGIAGYSLRLHGLEKGINNNLFVREIVMHPASYVSHKFADKYHEVGKSDGCLAVSRRIASRLINTIKGGTIIFSYFPNKMWLQNSHFLQ